MVDNAAESSPQQKIKAKKVTIAIICSSVVLIALIVAGIYIFLGNSNTHSNSPLAISNNKGRVICLGMDRSDVERVLGAGEPGSFSENVIVYNGGEFEILYRESAVVLMVVREEGWRTNDGVEVGATTKEQLFELYGSYLTASNPHNIFLDSNMNLLNTPSDNEVHVFEYIFAFNVTENNESQSIITTILFGDEIAGKYMR